MGRRAIFFDRDNTLNRNGGSYIGDWRQIVPMPGAREMLRAASAEGYLLFLISNQSGVGRGYFSMDDVHACNRQLCALVGQNFLEIGISTGTAEHPDSYRKPSPQFLFEMVGKYGLTPAHCWVIGDAECDMEMAANGGTRGILVHNSGLSLSGRAAAACRGRFSTLAEAWKFLKGCDG